MFLKSLGYVVLVSVPVGLAVVGQRSSSDPADAFAAYFLFLAHCPSVPGTDSSPEKPKALTIPGFRLNDTTGRQVALDDYKHKKAVAVVFIGTECPLVRGARRQLAGQPQQPEPAARGALGR